MMKWLNIEKTKEVKRYKQLKKQLFSFLNFYNFLKKFA